MILVISISPFSSSCFLHVFKHHMFSSKILSFLIRRFTWKITFQVYHLYCSTKVDHFLSFFKHLKNDRINLKKDKKLQKMSFRKWRSRTCSALSFSKWWKWYSNCVSWEEKTYSTSCAERLMNGSSFCCT